MARCCLTRAINRNFQRRARCGPWSRGLSPSGLMHEESDDHVGRHKMEYATPAIKTALRTIEAMPAVSRMESCQSCFGSNAMRHRWRQQSGGIDLDHGVIGAPATFPYIRGSAAGSAAALQPLEGSHGAARFLSQPNGWRSAASRTAIASFSAVRMSRSGRPQSERLRPWVGLVHRFGGVPSPVGAMYRMEETHRYAAI